MTLAEWLSAEKMTDEAFAERIGVSRSMVTKLRHRTTKPSFDSASRIMDTTNHKVGWNELMPVNTTAPEVTDPEPADVPRPEVIEQPRELAS